jgi:hypothetical protein
MARDEDIEIPGEEDENVGDDSPKKKREKRRKSKEERMAERRVVFWTLLIILVITFGFWLAPNIGKVFSGEMFRFDFEKKVKIQTDGQKTEKKNYVEITL